MGKPFPAPTTDSAPYWAGCNRGELLYQRCEACGNVQFYPRRSCIKCQAANMGWQASSRRGAIHSFTIVQRPANRAFDSDVPFVLGLIDLDEGYRMMMNIIGDDRLSAQIGRRVHIVFRQHTEDQKLPQAVLEAAP